MKFNIDGITPEERLIYESYGLTRFEYVTARLNYIFKLDMSIEAATTHFRVQQGVSLKDFQINFEALVTHICDSF
jgi:hypothetical protein